MNVRQLFNPFIRIAGWRALWFGFAAMAATAFVGSRSGVIFDGAIDMHAAPHTLNTALLC